MSRSKLIRKLKEKNPKLSQIEIELILDNFSKSIEKSLLDNKKVELRGFGTFFLKRKSFDWKNIVINAERVINKYIC